MSDAPGDDRHDGSRPDDLDLVVLQDNQGRYYLLRRTTLETARVPDEYQAAMAALVGDDVAAYGPAVRPGVQGTGEAALEYLIGVSSRLATADHQQQLSLLAQQLAALKGQHAGQITRTTWPP